MSRRIGIWLDRETPMVVSQGEALEVEPNAYEFADLDVVTFKVENDLAAGVAKKRFTGAPVRPDIGSLGIRRSGIIKKVFIDGIDGPGAEGALIIDIKSGQEVGREDACDGTVGDLVNFDFMHDEMACNISVKKRRGSYRFDGPAGKHAEPLVHHRHDWQRQQARRERLSESDELRMLVGEMTSTLRLALTAACDDARQRGHPQVTGPHWLLAILSRAMGDPQVVADTTGIDLDDLRVRLQGMIAKERVGGGTPTFAPEIGLLAHDAFRLVDREHGELKIRTGHVLWAALHEPSQGQPSGWRRAELKELVPQGIHKEAVAEGLIAARHEEAGQATSPFSDSNTLREILEHVTTSLEESLIDTVTSARDRGYQRVTILHWLSTIVTPATEDVRVVAGVVGLNLDSFRDRLDQLLAKEPTGAPKPAFAQDVDFVLRSAWAFVDRRRRETRIRSGHLLLASLAKHPELEEWKPLLRPLSGDEMKVDTLYTALAAVEQGEAEEALIPVGRL